MVWLLTWSEAYGEGFAIYELDARGTALGGAAAARRPDAATVNHNPAQMTRLPGTQLIAGLTAIGTTGRADWSRGGNFGRSPIKDAIWPFPHFYLTHRINDKFSVGVSELSRFGQGIEYGRSWPGRYNLYDIVFLTASLNPVLAYKVSDRLSVAAGVEFIYASMDMKKMIPVNDPGTGVHLFDIDSVVNNASDTAVGFNLAAHYAFTDKWAIGLQYRGPVTLRAKGDIDFSYSGPDDPFLQGLYQAVKPRSGTVRGKVTLPDSITVGLSYEPSEQISFELGAIWTRWSLYRNLDMALPGGTVAENPKSWKDTWRFMFGLEYEALYWLSLRTGYAWTESPMTGRWADYSVPTDNRHSFSVGAGFHNDRWSLDVTYEYVYCQARNYQANPASFALDGRGKITGQVVILSLGHKF
jgi:long-chain fatty acid transport protein